MNIDMNNVEKVLGNFAGLSAVTVALVGALKALFPAWIKGKEPAAALVVAYTLTVIAKITGVFAAHWLTLVYLPLLVAMAAAIAHDKILAVVKSRAKEPK